MPRFDVEGQVALVTGAARGLGRAIALALAEAGADIALGLRQIEHDSGLAKEIVARGRRVLPLQMDMTKLQQIQRCHGRRGSALWPIGYPGQQCRDCS